MSLAVSLSPRKQSSDTLGWRILVENGLSAVEQMARDVALAGEEIATVRFFRWKTPAISLGLKQEAPAWFNAAKWKQAGLEWVERPTGGGIGFHGSDLSIAVVVPRRTQLPLDQLMDAVCQNALLFCESLGIDAHTVLETPASGRINYCLMELSPYAVMAGGKKAAGFALRRFPQAWLIQGSMLIKPLPQALAAALPAEVLQQLQAKAVPLSVLLEEPISEADAAKRWSQLWAKHWEGTLLENLSKDES